MMYSLGYNAVWLATVWGPSHNLPFLGPLLGFVYCGIALLFSKKKKPLLLWIFLNLILGLFCESLNQYVGIITYTSSGIIAPYWVITLWGAFGMFFYHLLAKWHTHWKIILTSGALLAPLSYYSAANYGNFTRMSGSYFWAALALEWTGVLIVQLFLFRRMSHD